VSTKKISKRLVIDASIAQAAGGMDAVELGSKQCRDFLTKVLNVCHRLVMTPDISEEWNKHQSGFARRWRTSMHARRKVVRADIVNNDALCARIEALMSNDSDRTAVWKDMCLIEAALAADKIVTSRDETVRNLFADAAQHIWELREIVWVNPTIETEQPVAWLEAGAPNDAERQLGFIAGNEG
jgi:hypothetical protein